MRPSCAIAVFVFLAGQTSASAGDLPQRCVTRQMTRAEIARIEQGASDFTRTWARRGARSVVVPVWVHVISSTTGEGDIPDQMITDQINVLNNSYDGSPVGGARTPFGFSVVGGDRTVNDAWFTMQPGSQEERDAKTALRQGGPETLNLYIIGPAGGHILGYASFPWDQAAEPLLDGVVLLFDTLPGGTHVPYHLGDTATHEIGHWLGLFHPFEGGCTRLNDQVGDTPAERSPAFGCPVGRDSCATRAGVDAVENFMDYADDSCMRSFSDGQAARMDVMHAVYREGAPPAQLAFSAESVAIGEGGGRVRLRIERSGVTGSEVSVHYATSDGSATAGSDYTAKSGRLTFQPGVLSKTVRLRIRNDNRHEDTETFTVTLDNPTGGATLGATAITSVSITDNDQ